MHLSILYPSIYPSDYLLLNYWPESNQICYTTSHRKGVREQHYFSVSILLFMCCLCICPSRNLILNHWVEFNQTCYISSPHGKGVQEQHYFSVRLSLCPLSIHLFLMLSPLNYWAKFKQTCYITSPHGKGVCEQHYFSICHTCHKL